MRQTENQQKKKPLVEGHAHQIWAVARQGRTISCTENLHNPLEDDVRNAPLEMHAGYSVFNIGIATDNGGYTANIPAADVPNLVEEYRFQRNFLRKYELEHCNKEQSLGPAYEVRIPDRNCGNKTAAEVLKMPNGIQLLENAKKYLLANLQRYPRNQAAINAIDEALTLNSRGQLKEDRIFTLPPLYHTEFKYKRLKKEPGMCLVYFIDITALPGEDEPWNFTIQNCKAPLHINSQNKPGPNMKAASAIKRYEYRVSQKDMDRFIHRIENTCFMFETCTFQRQYKVAMKYTPDSNLN